MESMGYSIDDADYIYNFISQGAKEKFMRGDYSLGSLGINGQIINIVLELNGKGDKVGRTYKFKTGWTAYPYGELHNNTPFGGWVKGE